MNTEQTKVQNRSTKGDPILEALPRACSDEKTAVEFLEHQRWSESGPCCPECGSVAVYQMTSPRTGERQKNYRWRCRDCSKQYTVRTGTVFEDSKIPLHHWCFAYWRACTSKKGVSALEIHRQTGISYKSCLFMLHRIRFGMADNVKGPLGGDVEVDETYVGGKPRFKGQNKPGGSDKAIVMAMLERDGRVKAQTIADVTGPTLKSAIQANVDHASRIITDEHRGYSGIGPEFEGGHETVNHSAKEYVRGDVTTNAVEGFFSIFKRGLNGVYHAVSRKHLHRYVSEFEFRHNHRKDEDGPRVVAAIKASEGKRLLYREPTAIKEN